MTETNRIEYKRELTKDVDLEKEVIAFLNYHEGGVIYIGIDKHGVVYEIADLDSDMLKIKDRLKTNISPSCLGLFDVVVDTKDNKDIIKIIIASGPDKPYYKRKKGMSPEGVFIRIGTASEPMSQKMIDELYAKRTRHSIGKMKSVRQDLTFNQLKIYYEGKGTSLNKNFAKSLELVTETGEYNLVAYLMADENGNSIKLAKYSGENRVDLIENEEYGYCSLIKATNNILNKLDIENTTATKITSTVRESMRLWDAIALREAVLNAFVHNDFTTEVPPKFEIFSDRIEITSSGGLPNGLSQDEFFEGFSVPRNKELMRIYKDVGLVEQLGSGIPRILESYDKSCFQFSDNFLRMSFPKSIPSVKDVIKKDDDEISFVDIMKAFALITNKIDIDSKEVSVFFQTNFEILSEHLRNNFGITSEHLRNNFGITSENKIPKTILTLKVVALKPNVTAEEIGKILGVSSRSAETYIKKLRDINWIERKGSNKEGYWQINKQA